MWRIPCLTLPFICSASRLRGGRTFGDLRQSSEVVVSGACAFGRNHAGADWRFRRAGRAEDFAFPRLLDALQYPAALASLRVGDAQTGHGESQFGVEPTVTLLEF